MKATLHPNDVMPSRARRDAPDIWSAEQPEICSWSCVFQGQALALSFCSLRVRQGTPPTACVSVAQKGAPSRQCTAH
eukprot:1674023-Rhodomonas_salina.1